jgi:hypothetical protein
MLTVIRENAFMLNVMAPSIKLHLDWRYFVTKTPMAVAVAVLALHDESYWIKPVACTIKNMTIVNDATRWSVTLQS